MLWLSASRLNYWICFQKCWKHFKTSAFQSLTLSIQCPTLLLQSLLCMLFLTHRCMFKVTRCSFLQNGSRNWFCWSLNWVIINKGLPALEKRKKYSGKHMWVKTKWHMTLYSRYGLQKQVPKKLFKAVTWKNRRSYNNWVN